MVRVSINSSHWLAAVLSFAHVATAATVIAIDFSVWAMIAILAALAGSLGHSLWRHALLQGRTAFVTIELRGGDEAAVQDGTGAWLIARILGTSYISPMLTILNLQVQGLRVTRHIILVPDNVAQEDFRRLRVLLRWDYRKGDELRTSAEQSAKAGK